MSIQSIDQPTPSTEVIYKEIPNFPGYRVGSDGSVWTCRCRRKFNPAKWRRRKPGAVPPIGYLFVPMVGDDFRTHNRYIHRLVLEAFVGPCPEGMQACHNDGDPANNTVVNLRWDTASANNLDKRRHRTMPHGESHHMAVFGEVTAEAIRTLHQAGWSYNKIGIAFRICAQTAHNVVHGKTWSY